MPQTTKPDREVVRNWMQNRQVERVPPPSPERIREQLGWRLVEAERETKNHSR